MSVSSPLLPSQAAAEGPQPGGKEQSTQIRERRDSEVFSVPMAEHPPSPQHKWRGGLIYLQ